jgi:hypothetical protein
VIAVLPITVVLETTTAAVQHAVLVSRSILRDNCLCVRTSLQANIINDLLDFEILKGATAPVRVTRVDVDATVHCVVRMFTSSVHSKVRLLPITTCHSLLLLCALTFVDRTSAAVLL